MLETQRDGACFALDLPPFRAVAFSAENPRNGDRRGSAVHERFVRPEQVVNRRPSTAGAGQRVACGRETEIETGRFRMRVAVLMFRMKLCILPAVSWGERNRPNSVSLPTGAVPKGDAPSAGEDGLGTAPFELDIRQHVGGRGLVGVGSGSHGWEILILHRTRGDRTAWSPPKFVSLLFRRVLVSQIGTIKSAAGAQRLPTTRTMHHDRALLTSLQNRVGTIVTDDVLDELLVGLPQVRGNGLTLSGDAHGFAIHGLFVELPTATVPLALAVRRPLRGAGFVDRAEPIPAAPEPVIDDPDFPGILRHPHGHVASSAVASCPWRGAPRRVGPDAKLVARLDKFVGRLAVALFPHQATGQIWPSSVVAASISVQTLQCERLITRGSRSWSLPCEGVHL